MLSKNKVLFLSILFGILLSVNGQTTNTKDYTDYSKVNKEVLQNRSIKDLIKLITYRQIKNQHDGEYKKGDWKSVKTSKPLKLQRWDYTLGVTMYGMQLAYDILKDDKIINYINDFNHISANQYEYLRWQKYKFGTTYKNKALFKLCRLNMLDDCGAIGAGILESVLRHNCEVTPQLEEMLDIIGNYIVNVQHRLPDGTFWRPKFEKNPRIWADDLYMGLPFLVRWSEYTNDEKVLTDAAQQIINFASYLQDKKDGIWFHGYYVKRKERSLYKWGRANGWVAVAMAEVLSVLPESHPKYKEVLKIYKEQVVGLKKYQSKDGLWNQVIDHPELAFGTETSCSAQFTFAIARGIRKGWLDNSYINIVEKAVAGLKERISEEGGLYKVCEGTGIGENIEYYDKRTMPYDDSHGTGLMLLAITEVYHLLGDK